MLLSAYAIKYTLEIETGDIPSPDDYRDLSVVVERYVSEYMTSQFSASDTIIMTGVNTLTGNLDFQTPTLIAEYDSRACFSQGSEIPNFQTLDTALAGMLSTQDKQDLFITTINSLLPAGNIFKTSLVGVEFGNPPSRSRLDSGSGSSAAIASGVAGFTMLIAGMILYKRRRPLIEDYDTEKKLDKRNCGESTVDGDTFTGESYTTEPTSDGMGSVTCPHKEEYILPTNATTPIRNSDGGALSRDEWKKDLIDAPSYESPEDRVFNNHTMEKYDAFLNDSEHDDQLPSSSADPNLSIYEEDIVSVNESVENLSSSRESRAEPYSVDQIEAMLSYQV